MARPKIPIIAGERYGRLIARTVHGRNEKGQILWLCDCDCGKTTTATSTQLKAGTKKSCGCLSPEMSTITAKWIHRTHGYYGKYPSRTYRSWYAMRQRCSYPKHIAWARYGGIGISVCKAWRDSFESFLNDMGERPDGCSIDRLDNRFGYFMSNCRWSTRKEQQANRTLRSRSIVEICR